MITPMTGTLTGAGVGILTNVIGLGSSNKAAISQVKSLGENLLTTTRAINLNREQLDRELGDVLSSNALETAKAMATASTIMSMSGTVGGTTAQVSKQAYIDQIQRDADVIAQARNQDMALLNQAISERIQFRNQAAAVRSQVRSPLEAILGATTAALQGGMSGYSIGESLLPVGGMQTPQYLGGSLGEYIPKAHVTNRMFW